MGDWKEIRQKETGSGVSRPSMLFVQICFFFLFLFFFPPLPLNSVFVFSGNPPPLGFVVLFVVAFCSYRQLCGDSAATQLARWIDVTMVGF